MRNELVRLMSSHEYHSDPCEVPSFSHSMAVRLLESSPAHLKAETARLGGKRVPSTSDQVRGQVSHGLLLDRSAAPDFEVIRPKKKDGTPSYDYKSEEAKVMREAALSRGKVPVFERELEAYKATADAIATRFNSAGLNLWHEGAEHEVSLFWGSEDVQCRGRLDYFSRFSATDVHVVDVKAIASADDDSVRRMTIKCGYDMQQAAYEEGLTKLLGSGVTIDFAFGFYEIDAPHEVRIVRLAESFRTVGRAKWEKAKATWSRCMSSGEWPGYADMYLDAPAWELARMGVE